MPSIFLHHWKALVTNYLLSLSHVLRMFSRKAHFHPNGPFIHQYSISPPAQCVLLVHNLKQGPRKLMYVCLLYKQTFHIPHTSVSGEVPCMEYLAGLTVQLHWSDRNMSESIFSLFVLEFVRHFIANYVFQFILSNIYLNMSKWPHTWPVCEMGTFHLETG